MVDPELGERPADLRQLLADLAMDDRILFATDYPHWDFDNPEVVLPRALGDDIRARIFAANASSLYGIPAP